jgi:hypothetical protein
MLLQQTLARHRRADQLRAFYKHLMSEAAKRGRYDWLEGLMHRGSREVRRVLNPELFA